MHFYWLKIIITYEMIVVFQMIALSFVVRYVKKC